MKKEEVLRAIVDNVGKRGTPGEHLQNVISVAMLSEGWDAKNVTHIMGLRAFTSQLLCEQVIGRGLRRVGYDTEEVTGPDGEPRRLFRPEFVNVFGVPLSIFQHVGEEGDAPPPPKPSTQIDVLPERHAFEIRWPNVVRVDQVVQPVLSLDWEHVGTLQLDPATIPLTADLAPPPRGIASRASHYLWNGSRRRFVPDFLVRLVNGRTLVLEIKGEDSDQDKAKRIALDTWVRAVNSKGGFGVWSADVVFEMASMHDVIARHT